MKNHCTRLLCCLCLLLAWIGAPALQAAPTQAAPAQVAPAAAAWARDFAFAQLQLETIGDSESIPEGVVTSLAQDAQGFIWIGTQIGLVRFDGYHFRKYVHQARDPYSLAGDYVVSLLATPDGRLWVGTNSDGVSVFDPASERFENFAHDPKVAESLGRGRIWSMAQDARGGTWIGTDHGLSFLPAKAKSFRHFRHDPAQARSLMFDTVCSLLIDRSGRLWVGTTRGLQRLAENGREFETMGGPTLAGKNIQTLFQAKDEKLWIGTAAHGAAWLDAAGPQVGALHWLPFQTDQTDQTDQAVQTDSTRRLHTSPPLARLSHGWVAGIAQIDQQIWLATYGGGINIVSADDGRILRQLRHDPALRSSLALDVVVPLLLDRSGLLWIGTWAGGLQRFNSHNHLVRLLRHSPGSSQGLSRPDVHSMLELPNGQLLFGLNGNGIDIVDRKLGLVGGYRVGGPGGLPDNTVYALLQTPDGSLWAGTQQAGVVRRRAGSTQWEKIGGLSNQQVKSMLLGRDGSLWVGTSSGMARLPKALLAAAGARFEMVPDAFGKPLQSRIYVLAEDGAGRIWAGSDSGLWVFAPAAKGFVAIHKESGRADGLQSELASGLLFDRNGQLWVSSDKGIARLQQWDGQQARFEHLNSKIGMADKASGENLLQDNMGHIWTETAWFDPQQMQMLPLGRADGMDQGSSWSGSYLKTHDGLLLFGGTQGVAVINPALFQPWTYMPPVVLTGLKINSKPQPAGALLLPQAGSKQRSLTLKPDQRDLSLEFAALDYSDPKSNRYQYRLLGYDKEWIATDVEHRSASYGNLWPGHYTLQVRGSNRLGQWSTQELNIALHVLPAFWQTGWFVALLLLLLASLVALGYRWRVARLHVRARSLQALIDARTADILQLGEIGQELTATLDTEQAFERVYQQVSARLDVAVFLVGMVDAANIVFVYQIEHGQRLPNDLIDLDEANRPAAWCVREQRELVVNQRQQLAHYFGGVLPASVGNPMETVVVLPLRVEQQVIGCLSVQSPRPHAYSSEQLDFLRILASYTAIALSNSAAHSEVTQSHAELAAALDFLKETQAKLIEAERQQISLDLHDNLSQTMTGVLLQLDTAREVLEAEDGAVSSVNSASNASSKAALIRPPHPGLPYIDRAIALARDGIVQTRHLLQALRSKAGQIAPINLVQALQRDLPRLTVGTHIQVSVEQQGSMRPMLAKQELVLFRVAQEAVTNALRHSGGKVIRVGLHWQVDAISLSVCDDGCGFDVASKHGPGSSAGMGLAGMQQRVTALAGTLTIESGPGRGTCIRATLPLN